MKERADSLTNPEEIPLGITKEDIAASFLKTVTGIVPFGGIIGEILSQIIPNQKMERVIDFLEILNYRLSSLEQKIENYQLTSPEFTELLEEGINQASKSLSRERLEYIASLLKNSLTDEELDQLGKKKLFTILNQLNDAEIVWLRSYAFYPRFFGNPAFNEFYKIHRKILEPTPPNTYYSKEPLEITNKKALAKSYLTNLSSLGLLEEEFDRPKVQGEVPKFDEKTGKLKSKRTHCTALGMILLRYLDLSDARNK